MTIGLHSLILAWKDTDFGDLFLIVRLTDLLSCPSGGLTTEVFFSQPCRNGYCPFFCRDHDACRDAYSTRASV